MILCPAILDNPADNLSPGVPSQSAAESDAGREAKDDAKTDRKLRVGPISRAKDPSALKAFAGVDIQAHPLIFEMSQVVNNPKAPAIVGIMNAGQIRNKHVIVIEREKASTSLAQWLGYPTEESDASSLQFHQRMIERHGFGLHLFFTGVWAPARPRQQLQRRRPGLAASNPRVFRRRLKVGRG